jgi:hypothetical protein
MRWDPKIAVPRAYPWVKVVRFLGVLLGLYLLGVMVRELLQVLFHSYSHRSLFSVYFLGRLSFLAFAGSLVFPWRMIKNLGPWFFCFLPFCLSTIYSLLPSNRVFVRAFPFAQPESYHPAAVITLYGFFVIILVFQPLALGAMQYHLRHPTRTPSPGK